MDNPEKQLEKKADDVQPKQQVEGKVLKTSLQGALVDIGSKLPAFIHISQVVKDNNPKLPVNSIEEVLKVGDAVTVWVKRVKKDRVELTMIPPLMLEWREIKPEMVVKGKVIRLETFGVFVEIGAERPGLVHISELAHSYVRTPNEVVHEGDDVEVKVLEIDRRKKQIKLSMKALQEVPDEPEPEKPQKPGRKPKAKKEEVEPVETEAVIPDPTFMEIALRQAMERADRIHPRRQMPPSRKSKDIPDETQDLFDRTIKSKNSKD